LLAEYVELCALFRPQSFFPLLQTLALRHGARRGVERRRVRALSVRGTCRGPRQRSFLCAADRFFVSLLLPRIGTPDGAGDHLLRARPGAGSERSIGGRPTPNPTSHGGWLARLRLTPSRGGCFLPGRATLFVRTPGLFLLKPLLLLGALGRFGLSLLFAPSLD